MKAFVFLLLAMFSCAQAAEEKKVEQKEIGAKATESKKAPEKSPPIVINVTGNKETLNHPDNSKCCNQKPKENWWERLWTDPIATFTGLLAFVTAGLIYIGVRQEIHLRDTARKELRAYVALEDIFFTYDGMPAFSTREFPWPDSHVKIRVMNYGKTPAHEMEIWVNVTLTIDPGYPFPYSSDIPIVGRQMLHPGQHYSIDVARDYPEKALHAWYIYGRILYRDIYRRYVWVTRFCYHYEGKNRFVPLGPYNKEKRYDSYQEAISDYSEI